MPFQYMFLLNVFLLDNLILISAKFKGKAATRESRTHFFVALALSKSHKFVGTVTDRCYENWLPPLRNQSIEIWGWGWDLMQSSNGRFQSWPRSCDSLEMGKHEKLDSSHSKATPQTFAAARCIRCQFENRLMSTVGSLISSRRRMYLLFSGSLCLNFGRPQQLR